MNRFFIAVLLLCLDATAANSQKWRIGQPPPTAQPGVDYPVRMHISGIHLRDIYLGSGLNETVAYIDVVMSGKKFELCGNLEPYPSYHIAPPLPGDYRARLTDKPKKNGSALSNDPDLGKHYELVMSDGALWRAKVTGIAEAATATGQSHPQATESQP